jgi:hypothetical protein
MDLLYSRSLLFYIRSLLLYSRSLFQDLRGLEASWTCRASSEARWRELRLSVSPWATTGKRLKLRSVNKSKETKETYHSVNRDLLPLLAALCIKRDLVQCQKRPSTVSKENYYRQKRPITVSKGTYLHLLPLLSTGKRLMLRDVNKSKNTY